MVELGVAAPLLIAVVLEDSRLQQPSRVQNDPHRLAALGLVAARNQLAAPRRRRPAHVTQVVALEILAQALKVAAQPALLAPAQLQLDLPSAREENLLVLALPQRRIHAHRLLHRRHGPALHQSKWRSVTNVDCSGARIPALARLNFVSQRRANPWKNAQVAGCGSGHKRLGQVIHDTALKNRLAALLHGNLNLGFAVERGRVAPRALHADHLRGG